MRKWIVLGVAALLGQLAADSVGQQGLVDQTNQRVNEYVNKWQDGSQAMIDSYWACEYLIEYLEDEILADPMNLDLQLRLVDVSKIQIRCEKGLKDYGLEFDGEDWVNIVPGGDPENEFDRHGLLWFLQQAIEYQSKVNNDNNILTNWGRALGMVNAGMSGRGGQFASEFQLPDEEPGNRCSWGRLLVWQGIIDFELNEQTY